MQLNVLLISVDISQENLQNRSARMVEGSAELQIAFQAVTAGLGGGVTYMICFKSKISHYGEHI